MRYEVQHYTIFWGWVNTWSYADENGAMQPETFSTAEEAQAALDEYFQDLEEEVEAGHIEPYSRSEFRVWEETGSLLIPNGLKNAAGGAP